MSRVDRQAEQLFEKKLDYLRTVSNDMRQAQTFGASDVRIYRLFNAASNVDITLSAVTTTTTRCVEVTLTPNTAASNPVISLNCMASYTAIGGGVVNAYTQPLVPVNGVQKFRVYLKSGDSTKDIGVALNFWTISPGTYTVAEVTP